MNENYKLGNDLVDAMNSTDMQDLVKEYVEFGVDAALEDGILKDVPLVGTIITLAKVGISIRDRMLIKKILKFFEQLDSLSVEERSEMINRLETDKAFGRKVGEHLIEILDRIEIQMKPEMVAIVFKAYAKGEIDARTLNRLNMAIERIPSYEISRVREFFDMSPKERLRGDELTWQALVGAGLAIVVSGYGALIFEPTAICDDFLRLDLDQVVYNKNLHRL